MEFYSLSAYNDSHLLIKAEEVFGYGEYIESMISEASYIKLFAYSNFYVEVIYDQKAHSIIDIKALTIDQATNKYVSLTEFYNELKGIPFL